MHGTDELDKITEAFVAEARTGLDRADAALVGLERNDRAAVDGIFRTIHTIKGTASFLELVSVEHVAHAGESLLAELRDGHVEPSEGVVAALATIVDRLRDLVAATERARLARRGPSRPPMDAGDSTVPMNALWASVPRLVRVLTRAGEVRVDVETLGGSVAVAPAVAAALRDPVVHLVRNAVDHGLESPDERMAAGKSPVGHLTLVARPSPGAVRVEVRDDGRGLRLARLRQRAVDRGLLTPGQAVALTSDAAAALVFEPGVSTADRLTCVSGRGVGLDIVRTNVESLGGTVEVVTSDGAGTTFALAIPTGAPGSGVDGSTRGGQLRSKHP